MFTPQLPLLIPVVLDAKLPCFLKCELFKYDFFRHLLLGNTKPAQK